MMCYLFNEAQNQRQYDENDAHPFGHTRECGVQGLGFALGEKCLGAVAGHGAGKTAALSGLEEHNGDEKNAGEQLDYGKDDGESVHEIQPFLLIKKKRRNMRIKRGVYNITPEFRMQGLFGQIAIFYLQAHPYMGDPIFRKFV